MSAIGFTPIQLYRTATASAVPSPGNLADGELAINLTDEKLYFKNAAGVVKLLAANLNVVANGGTGATTLSANGVLIGNGTSAVTAVVGTTGRVLTGNTGGAPSFEPIGNVAVSSISFGTTGLTPSAPTQGAVTVSGTLAVANGGTGVTTSTGTGSVVLNTSPTLVTPILGAASATSIANGLGAVGTPSYTFTGDLNTGMWSPAADTVAVSTGGAERVRVTSAGNVGIGTSSPGSKLTVAGGYADLGGLRIAGSSVDALNNIFLATGELSLSTASGAVVFKPNLAEAVRITSVGNVGIGTSSPGFKLDIASGDIRLSNTNGIRWGSSDQAFIFGDDGEGGGYLQFGINSERMRITSAGNVGIGTSSPTGRLDILSTAAGGAAYMRVANGSSTAGSYAAVSFDPGNNGFNVRDAQIRAINNGANQISLGFLVANGSSPVEAMRIDNAGNVGIGTSSPNGLLHLASASPTFYLDETDQATDEKKWRWNAASKALSLQTTNDAVSAAANAYQIVRGTGTAINRHVFFTGASSERMRIDSAGNLLVGTTSTDAEITGVQIRPSSIVATNSSTVFFARRTGSNGALFEFRRDATLVGSISVTTTTTSYNTTSDRRLKHDIVDAPDAADLIDAIKVRSFKWNADNSEQRYGMIAQELLEVAPEAVSAPENPDEMMSVDYSKLVPMLIKEVQQLRARVAQLEGN